MAIFKQDMHELIMDAGGLYILDPLFAAQNGGELMFMWKEADTSVSYIYDYSFCDDETLSEAKFFVMADYLTYIPYGSVGYAAFEEMLKAVRPDMSVAEYRFEWLKRQIGRLEELNEGQLGYVRYYFENYGKRAVNLKIPAEVVAFVCRYHHECEANFGKSGFDWQRDISDSTSEFSSAIAGMYKNAILPMLTRSLQKSRKAADLATKSVSLSANSRGLTNCDCIRAQLCMKENFSGSRTPRLMRRL